MHEGQYVANICKCVMTKSLDESENMTDFMSYLSAISVFLLAIVISEIPRDEWPEYMKKIRNEAMREAINMVESRKEKEAS